jgi:hypothetical protein
MMAKHGLKKKLEYRKKLRRLQLHTDDEKNAHELLRLNFGDAEHTQASELTNTPLQSAQRFTLASELMRLQGNQHLQRLVMPSLQQSGVLSQQENHAAQSGTYKTRTVMERFSIKATIQRKPDAQAVDPIQVARSRQDAAPGAEHKDEEYRAIFEKHDLIPENASNKTETLAAPPEDQGLGVPISVPDIEVPALGKIERTDAINGKFTYKGSITKGPDTPSDGNFGETLSFSSKLKDITITPKASSFEVSATFEHPIVYKIRSGTGPDGQVDISSETDSDITKDNYTTVASDLTPNMSDLKGRPPRTKFWAEDLTVKHELVHAKDDRGNGPGAMATVTTWLNGQTAADVDGVKGLLSALPGRFATALLAALSTEDGEKHAYSDGADLYEARANAITSKGDKGEYK